MPRLVKTPIRICSLMFFTQTNIDGGFGSTITPFGDVDGYTIDGNLGNVGITPEFTTSTEFGIDLTFLEERIGLDFVWYKSNSTDQIIKISIPTSSGYDSKTINIGEVQNDGVEFLFKAIVVKSQDFRWDVNFSYTKNNNEVISLAEGVDQVVIGGTTRMAVVAAVGHPYGTFFGQDLAKDPEGRVIVDSASGLPQVNTNAELFGSYLPDYQMSFGTRFSFKNWSLGMLFDSKQGGQFWSRTKDIMAFVGTSHETENRTEDQAFPNSVYLASDGAYKENSTPYSPYDYFTAVIPDGRHLVDASYVKFRELSLTYNFPENRLDRSIFGSLSLTFFANNLMIWTAEENEYTDPEMNSSGSSNTQGFDFTPTPSQRNYGFNLRETF